MNFVFLFIGHVTIISLRFLSHVIADKTVSILSDSKPDQLLMSPFQEHMIDVFEVNNHHSLGNYNSTHQVDGYSPTVAALLALVLIPIAITTVGGNFLVILAVTLVKKLRTPSNILIVSLAFSDFLVGLLVLPFAIIDLLRGYWPFNERLCDMFISFDVLLCTASILNLCAISIDRYLVITRPLTYVSKRTPCRMWQMIAATWVISVLICIPPNIGWKAPFEKGKCQYSEDVGYQIYATFCAFYLPLIVMLVLYGRIFKLAREKSRTEQKQLTPSSQNNIQEIPNTQANSSLEIDASHCISLQNPREKEQGEHLLVTDEASVPVEAQVENLRNKKRDTLTNGRSKERESRGQTTMSVNFSEKEMPNNQFHSSMDLSRRKTKGSSETKVIKTIGIIMGCFCLCWLPFFMMQLLLALLKAGKVKTDDLVPKAVFQFLQWLGYVNSSLNPLIYAKFNQEFRLPFKLILLCQCRNINARLRSAAFSAQYGLSSSTSRKTSFFRSTSNRTDRRSRPESLASGRPRPQSQLHRFTKDVT